MKPTIRACIVAAMTLITGCDRRPDVGSVIVSVVGARPTLADRHRPARPDPDRVLTGAIAQGLVRFDASGQIEPGLAERWIVIDGGRTYIFRLRHAHWPDGDTVTAGGVVAALKRQIAPGSRNPLAPYLTAIDQVIEMTPDVVEIDLSRPRPELLKLFAQPELGILQTKPAAGSGPFRIVATGAAPLLAPVADPDRAGDAQDAPTPEDNVRLIGERAAKAIVRFAAKRSDMVAGGTLSDWPLVQQAELAPSNVRIDPAAGLFGLAVVDRSGFLADPRARAAVAQAFDRAALTAVFSSDWAPTEQILPEQLDSAASAALPDWTTLPLADRRAAGRGVVAAWKEKHPDGLSLRLALPGGPGGTLLWGRLAADLIAIGITPVRVGWTEDADLRLIDKIAPYDSARWYLVNACVDCRGEATDAIETARTADTIETRAVANAAADIALTQDVGFIPIARPFRWSLVAFRLHAWQPNARAWHPLNHLRADTK